MPPTKVNKKEKKEKFLFRLYELLSKHKQIVIVTLDNVGSFQIQQIRKEIAKGGGLLLIGKNTVIRKIVELRTKALDDPKLEKLNDKLKKFGAPIPELNNLLPLISKKVGMIFTDEPVFSLKPKIEENKIAAAARVGVFAPIDVIIPPGPTGMDPSQISFFHALQISTKIQKGQIEITKDYQVCTVGKKIGSSEVALLQKMNMKPFFYNMQVIAAYDNGTVLGKEVIGLSPEDILEKFSQGVKNITALSLAANIPTEASVPHFVTNAFKNLAAIGMQIDYKFKQIASAGKAPAPAPKKEEKKDEKKKEEPKKEAPKQEEPQEQEVDMGGLFDF